MQPVYKLVKLCEWLNDVADLELHLSLDTANWTSTWDLSLTPHVVDKHTTIVWCRKNTLLYYYAFYLGDSAQDLTSITLDNNYTAYLAICCLACRTYEIATRFWVVVICPIIKCLTVLEFSFILFDLCLFITILNFILNYVLIVTFWIFTYHEIWILLIIYCFIWNYWIIYFLTCLEVFWSVVS